MHPEEQLRLEKLLFYEKQLQAQGFGRIAGVDEAGRGPLAGPVVAAACILPQGLFLEGLNDSKKLTAAQRELLFLQLTTHPQVQYGLGIVEAETIDRINILQATFLAMQQAVANLAIIPDHLLIDGNQKPLFSIPASSLIKGDSLSLSIAAASVLAKVTRDRLLDALDEKWPQYGFKKHKGYGTASHVAAIQKWGPCPSHRKSFEPIKSQLNPSSETQFSLLFP